VRDAVADRVGAAEPGIQRLGELVLVDPRARRRQLALCEHRVVAAEQGQLQAARAGVDDTHAHARV
jgi:hypothetical protein